MVASYMRTSIRSNALASGVSTRRRKGELELETVNIASLFGTRRDGGCSSAVRCFVAVSETSRSQGSRGQVTAPTVQGIVNCRAEERSRPIARPSGLNFSSAAISRRRGRHWDSPSRLVLDVSQLKATARTGAEASEDSTDGDDDGDDATIEQSLLQRRQLLWGATGSLTWLSSVGLAVAKPIPPAIFSPKYCTDNIYPNQGAFPNVVEDCCLPDGSSLTPKDFVFEKLPMRTRKSAHVLSEDAAWAFLPWHRMYLYFHERFLSDLIGDPTFALPFWNWDNQRPDAGGNKMPRMFVPVFFPGPLSNLQKAFRNTDHYPPEIVRLDRDNPGSSPKDVQVNNLVLMHRTVVSSTSDVTFLGSAYRANHDGRKPSAGSAENDGHNKIHVWTGSGDQGRHPFKEDMGTFVRARKESDDPDFLNAKFAFYDHKGEIVHVKVSQTLSTEDLSYKYEIMESDKDWINFEFQTVDEAKPSPEDISRYAETPAVFKKDESATFRLLRGEPVPFGRLAADEVEEILVIKGVKTPMRSFMAYKVFINLPDADPSTKLDIHNFVGMITNLPHNMSKAHSSSGVDFRLSIGAWGRFL
ncbi:hypothetical protein AXG93_4831s1350 [Marchantia polymorpha subsp. ruderalis]|uniref:Tyrosinase copper-binding domain-containing protein n=1 Tax=Marchantia polymorpha subsp. ruderalis TaxID=1480154 RepID=A0A176W8N2_MARPO|nr:hypothetical protein AXG93_4831s1350 [Marchantia polymorpha subsp. ruderalis]